MTSYTTLLLSGGAMKSIGTLGVIQYYEDHNLLDRVSCYIGASAGAVISYLHILGYKPFEMMSVLCSHELFKNYIPNINVLSLWKGGAISFSPFQELLETLTIQRLGELVTLGRLEKLTDKKLVISVYNYDTHQIEYLSSDTDPELPCIAALRMSCAIPGIFPPYSYRNTRYIDPCVVEHVPLGYVASLSSFDDLNVLGIICEPYIYWKEEESLYTMIHNLSSINMSRILQYQLHQVQYPLDIVRLNTHTHFLDFHMNSKEKLDLFSKGYQKASSILHFDATTHPIYQLEYPVSNSSPEDSEEEGNTTRYSFASL